MKKFSEPAKPKLPHVFLLFSLAHIIALWSASPIDNAWKLVTLETVAARGVRVLAFCYECPHSVLMSCDEAARRFKVSMDTPMLTIGNRLKCTKCGARNGGFWSEPYSMKPAQRPLKVIPASPFAWCREALRASGGVPLPTLRPSVQGNLDRRSCLQQRRQPLEKPRSPCRQ